MTFHRLPRLRILTSVKNFFPLSLCSDVGPMVGFLIMFSKNTCFTEPSIFEIGLATFFYHHGCRVFWTCPIFSSWYFGPRENSPTTHLQATLLSPHNCTVGPSRRVWIVVSAGPKSLCVWSLVFSSIPLLFFALWCWMDSERTWRICTSPPVFFSFFLLSSSFFVSRFHGHLIPHISTIVSSPIMFPSCVVFRISLHHSCV